MDSTVSSLPLPSLTSDERERLLAESNLCTLYALFTTLPDPRSKQGQRYDLPYLLTCLVAALRCNCNSTLAVAQWCCDQRDLLEQLFGPWRFYCPSDSLYRRLLPGLSAEHLEWAIAAWVRATLVARPDEPVALDGKTVRGAKEADQPAAQLLSFCTHERQEILVQMRVDEKTNAHPYRPMAAALSARLWTGLHRRCPARAIRPLWKQSTRWAVIPCLPSRPISPPSTRI